MKKVKFILIGIILALLVVFAFQNLTYFQEKHRLGLNLIVAGPYTTPEISNAVICIITFVFGVVVFYLLSMSGRIKRRKSIKELNHSLSDRQNEVASLKNELNASQASTSGQILPDDVSTTRELKETVESAAEKASV